jgi:hypothetical protein
VYILAATNIAAIDVVVHIAIRMAGPLDGAMVTFAAGG